MKRGTGGVKRTHKTKLREIRIGGKRPTVTNKDKERAGKAVARIEHEFLQAYSRLASMGYEVRAIAHKNRDHTVDADLTVQIPRGQEARGLLVDVEQALSRIKDVWISVGIRTPPKAGAHDESDPTKKVPRVNPKTGEPQERGGVREAGAYFQRSTPLKWAENFATGRDIVDNFAKYGRRKPEQAYVRVHWNPWDTKPTRS